MEANMNKPAKRKRIVLTLEEKLDVIKMSDNGIPHEVISHKFNIGHSTLKDIINKRGKIESAVTKDRKFGLNRKVLKEGKKPEVEEQLYNYVCEQTKKGLMVSNKDLIDEASVLNENFYKEKWIPSKGWLGKFKNRYSLNNRTNEQNQIVEVTTETLYKEEQEQIDDGVEIIEESPIMEVTIDQKSPQVCEISAASAADILLEFMTEHNYPLKEIITMRIMRDKIHSNPQSQTLYEVIQNQEDVLKQEDEEEDEMEILVKYEHEIE
jgi:CENP-B N-terminal DNA-binding domain/Tc5 transposase DNA-binding domain